METVIRCVLLLDLQGDTIIIDLNKEDIHISYVLCVLAVYLDPHGVKTNSLSQ